MATILTDTRQEEKTRLRAQALDGYNSFKAAGRKVTVLPPMTYSVPEGKTKLPRVSLEEYQSGKDGRFSSWVGF
jgi:hypothetical protein